MGTYAQRTALVGELKRAAIDAWMRDRSIQAASSDLVPEWHIEGDQYASDVNDGHQTFVTRPGTDGSGGGEWSSNFFISDWIQSGSKSDSYRASFDAIRQRIDQAVAPWLDLPDPSDLGSVLGDCTTIVSKLATNVSNYSNGTSASAGYIDDFETDTEQILGQMSGETIDAFRYSFLRPMWRSFGVYCDVSMGQVEAVIAQQGLWESSREGFVATLEEAIRVCNAIAEYEAPSQWAVSFTVVGWIAAAVSTLATGGLAKVAGLAGVATDIITSHPSASPANQPGPGTYEGAMGSFEGSLSTLNEEIADEEDNIQSHLNTKLALLVNPNGSDVGSNTEEPEDDVNPTLPSVDPDHLDISGQGVYVNPERLSDLWSNRLPELSLYLNQTADEYLGLSTYSAVSRDANIGNGPSGPSGAFADVNNAQYRLLRDAAWDIDLGARQMELAIAEIEQTDGANSQQLENVISQNDAGNPYSPDADVWDWTDAEDEQRERREREEAN
ncbi:hypothetical protein [Citricoccus sp. NR2]|uniref:hypothetical protein n=1 Tax=Citricoccus sp. NR2 TaxID=3004095 RepID=UPI0022DD5FEB|nr:hypothetical protein [Citricoccus sp. NR2]WBL19679.1 hypothetical protein O1A05_03005 [Citricoccus sp. NR2]